MPREHSDLFGKGGRESLAALELRDAQPRRLDNLIALICDFDRKIEHTTGGSSWAHCTRSPGNPPSGIGGRPSRRKHGGFGPRPNAPWGGRTRSPLPRRGGPLDRRDRPPARTRRSHVKATYTIRSAKRHARSSAIPGRLPGLRRADQRAQRQGRRVRLLQTLPSGAIAREWTRERSREAMRACERATGLPRPPTTGRAPTHAGAAAKRSNDYRPEIGPRRPL